MTAQPSPRPDPARELLQLLGRLPPAAIAALLEHARALERSAPANGPRRGIMPRTSPKAGRRLVPPGTLSALSGLVSLGGDALRDAEALYDE